LEKERDRRYGSAAAFAQDLERYLKNEPVEAGPPSPVYRLRKLVRRNRLAFAAVVAIFISLAVGIGLTTWQWQRAEEQKEGQEKLLWTASRSDHEAALNAFVDGQNARGLAHLVRALEYRPMNDAALAASAAHVFANDSVGWRTRLILAFEKPVISVAFSQDDRFLSTADRTGTLRVIEIATGLEISRRRSHKLPRTLSPNGRLFASSDSGNLLILETDSDKEFSRISFGDELDSVSFSPDSRFLVAGIGSFSSKFHEARVIETATGRVVSKTEFSKWGDFGGLQP
jgi:hypothetical protein